MFKGLWQSSWEFLNTNISVGETIQGGVDTTKAVLDLSKAINENKTLPELTPLLGHLSSILDVLNLPIVQLAGSALPFVSIASKLLQVCLDSTREDLSLEDCVELVGQAAYLESLKKFFSDDANKHLLEKLNKAKASDRLQKEISKLSKSLTLTEAEAWTVLLCFHESKLAKGLNPIVLERLVEAGIKEGQAKIIVERIARMTHREIKPALAEIKDKVNKLNAIFGSEWQRELETYYSIDKYLEDFIAKQPSEQVFDDNFDFEDIYVELQVEEISENTSNSQPQFIEEWALGLLNDESKSRQVLFIQGEPARGKSVFCRMFVDRVRRELYPIWIPILIRLRYITNNFADDFDTLLGRAVDQSFATSDNWLRNRNTRFLFVLDGFDELLLEHVRDLNLKNFLDRVSEFQTKCQGNSERGHRVIITGRPFALFGIEDKDMPKNLERVKILDMRAELQEQWLQKWAKLKGTDKAQEFKDFLSNLNCPEQVKTLAKEPMLMYFLAAMHTDGNLKIENFQNAGNSNKILIYEQTLDWVLDKQRSEGRKNLNQALTKLDKEELRYILKEAGLCVVQSGGIFTTLDALKDRLAPNLVTKLKAKANTENEEGRLPVALATFYLKSSDVKDNSMEFLHKSFSEFLCAERFVDSLMEWSQQKPNSSDSHLPVWTVDKKDLEWQIYDLFGFGSLTPEIVEYLAELIKQNFKHHEPEFIRLFERLSKFYSSWSNGTFIEAIDLETEILPFKKARQMQKLDISKIGQRKVDVYTGLNILILLFTLYRYAQTNSELKDEVVFHPCIDTNTDELDSSRLSRIINYSQCYADIDFTAKVGGFMSKVDLRHVELYGVFLGSANLNGVNLSDAYLRGAYLGDTFLNDANLSRADLSRVDLSDGNLERADLSDAEFSCANLSRTNFRHANLSRADLSNVILWESSLCNANLSDADLSDTDLSNADLSGADLSGANLSNANLNNILWDEFTKWSAQGLKQVVNIPNNLSNSLQFRAAVLLCESNELLISGNVENVLTNYKQAQNIDPQLETSVSFYNQLCWFGSLHNRATDVLFACDKAVELEESGVCQDTRGLARALTGNLTGAIEDFEAAINSGELEEEILEKRQRWLEALKSGINPFTHEELEALRASEGATS
ncbi:MAG: low-complexity protein [Pseudanabaena frigida]|uniref:Low-complexity protein n=1 Tax=Pseudanabaena frigida TaxID=945775 RepID=A0A2W4W940_9CYAN|nr:MAG: low-complexity protein [Pseudanabaena frigida]